MQDTPAWASAFSHARRAAEVHTASAIHARRLQIDDREDVIQDALLGLCYQIGRFDPARSSIRTFVEHVVQSRITSALRRQSAIKRRIQEPLPMLGGALRFDLSTEVQTDVLRALAQLSPHDRMVAMMLVEMSPAAAARSLQIARSTLYIAIARIRAVFVEAGLYPSAGRTNSTRTLEPKRLRTRATAAPRIAQGQRRYDPSSSARRNVNRKADTPVGGL
jgi:RNA polymerase sigma factor (sigma-70 family)